MAIAFNENQCGFCKSHVPHGATVCARCGAFKGKAYQASGGSGIFWPGVVLVALGIMGIWACFDIPPDYNHPYHYTEWQGVAFGVVIFAIGAWSVYFFGKKGAEPTWLRRH